MNQHSLIFIAIIIGGAVTTIFGTYFHVTFRGLRGARFSQISVTREGNFSSFEDWRNHVYSTRYYYCPRTDFCASGFTLPYKRTRYSQHPLIFLYSLRKCPATFQEGVIYHCSRGSRRTFWRNTLMRNKQQQWRVYAGFDMKLKTLIANGTTPSKLGCLTDEPLESLYVPLNEFYPETFLLTTRADARRIIGFLEKQRNRTDTAKQRWIFKSSTQREGVNTAVRTVDEAISHLQKLATIKDRRLRPSAVVQRFIESPMLLNGKKIQFRTWAIVFNEDPLIVTAHIGHMRQAFVDYNKSKSAKNPNDALLTNTAPKNLTIEQYHAHFRDYKDVEEYLQADPEHRAYTDHNGIKKYLPENVIEGQFIPYMLDVMRTTMSATYTVSENYIVPANGTSIHEVGWTDAAVVTKVCFDFIVTKSGKLFLTEENHLCGNPSYHGRKSSLNVSAEDFMPRFKKNLVWSLDVVSIKIREKMYYLQQIDRSYSLDKFSEDELGWHIPLIDNSRLSHIPREQRMFCNARLFDPALLGQKMKRHFPQYKTSDRYCDEVEKLECTNKSVTANV